MWEKGAFKFNQCWVNTGWLIMMHIAVHYHSVLKLIMLSIQNTPTNMTWVLLNWNSLIFSRIEHHLLAAGGGKAGSSVERTCSLFSLWQKIVFTFLEILHPLHICCQFFICGTFLYKLFILPVDCFLLAIYLCAVYIFWMLTDCFLFAAHFWPFCTFHMLLVFSALNIYAPLLDRSYTFLHRGISSECECDCFAKKES